MAAGRLTATGALLQVVAETTAPLSERFVADHAYRATVDDKPKWSKIAPGSEFHCDECAVRQHETRGAYGPRKQPRQRRVLSGGPVLRLCAGHAQAWHDLDGLDITTTTGRSGNPGSATVIHLSPIGARS